MASENEAKKELMEFIVEISDGIIGAVRVLTEMLQSGAQPKHLGVLKEFNLKGSLLWVLYKDVCLQDIPMLLAFLEACHEGDVGEADIKPYLEKLMLSRDDAAAREMRENYVHPAVRKFIAQHLEAGGDVG
jgi:hypothetical protein